jgi:hypothetical protein
MKSWNAMAFMAGGTSGRRVLMSDEAMRALAEKAFEAKRLHRTKLARLPIERKLEILLDLQRTVNEIARAVGRPTKAEWPREILPRPDTG